MALSDNPLIKNLPHIMALLILAFVLMFVLVRFGYIRCCDIPGFCDIYYGIVGYPKIAIVYGTEGIGNPNLLEQTIIEQTHQVPAMIPLDYLTTSGVLDKYALVIVERARTIDTSTLYVFRDFIAKGGKLAWIADAGAGLGDSDYMCLDVAFHYLPAYQVETGEDEFQTVCADEWGTYTVNIPRDLESGVCGHTFAEIVVQYVNEKNDIYDLLTTSNAALCEPEEDNFVPDIPQRLEACIETLENHGIAENDITQAAVDEYCVFSDTYPYAENYWNRGPSTTPGGDQVNALNFGSVVLGADFVDTMGVSNLFMQPVDTSHPLVRGYGAGTEWFGVGNVTLVDVSKYTLRSASIMDLRTPDGKYRPAIIVSSPVGPLITKTGLVIYYAFPPEAGIEQGVGKTLIGNLISFVLCK